MTAAAVAAFATGAHAEVRVVGAERSDPSAVAAHVPRSGAALLPAEADEALRSLYATGAFEDVAIEQSGEDVVVTVSERPFLEDVRFVSSARVPAGARDAAALAAGAWLREGEADAAAARISAWYAASGRPDAVVRPRLEKRPRGGAVLAFEIDRGPRAGIGRVWFSGNDSFSSARLATAIETRRTGLLSLLSGADAYDIDRLERDREAIEAFYRERGYAAVRVSHADVDRPGGGGFVVGFRIDEGPLFRVSSVTVHSTVEGFAAAPSTRAGDVLDRAALDRAAERMADEARRQGLFPLSVVPRVSTHADGSADVEYQVDRAGRAYVERIQFEGLARTRDATARRELDFAEGDMLDPVLVRRAERRLMATGHFERVGVTVSPGSAGDRVTVLVRVDERQTGEFSAGGGWSTRDGPLATVALGDSNLAGTGRSAFAEASRTGPGTAFRLTLSDPWLFGSPVRGDAEAFHETGEVQGPGFAAYRERRTGGRLSATLPLDGHASLTFHYLLSSRTLSDVDPRLSGAGTPGAPALVEGGTHLTSAAGYRLQWNGRDGSGPGFGASFAQEAAGLGGDVRYLKTEATAEAAAEPFRGSGVRAGLSGRAGHVAGLGGPLAFPDHFRAGGRMVRGFAHDGFGPMDAATGYHLGGTLFAAGTAELTFPAPVLPPEYGLRGAVFADAGAVWSPDGRRLAASGATLAPGASAVRASAGVGLAWDSPFGLLRADLAWPVLRQPGDREQVFSFTGGTRF